MLAGCATTTLRHDRRVLVADFEFSNFDPGFSLAELMTAQLANHERFVTLERRGLEAQFGRVASNQITLQDLGRQAGADYIVVGSVMMIDQNYVLTARLFSVLTGRIVGNSSVTRSCRRAEDLYPLLENISDVLAHHLGVLADRHDRLARTSS